MIFGMLDDRFASEIIMELNNIREFEFNYLLND
jgi:hypothetical protein